MMADEEFEWDAAKSEAIGRPPMSKENTIVAKRQSDGTVVQVLPDGSTKPFEDETDWVRLQAMTGEEVMAAAMADPDAIPMTADQLRTARRVPRTRIR